MRLDGGCYVKSKYLAGSLTFLFFSVKEIKRLIIDWRYGEKEPIKVQFGANPPEGKKVNITSFTPSVCNPCRIAR